MQTLIRNTFPIILAILINLGYGFIKLSFGVGEYIYAASLAASWAYLTWMFFTKESVSWLTKLVGFLVTTSVTLYLLGLLFIYDLPPYFTPIALLSPLLFALVWIAVPNRQKPSFSKSELVLLFVGILLLFMQTASNYIHENESNEWITLNQQLVEKYNAQAELNEGVLDYIEATNPDPVLSIYQDVKLTNELISHVEYMKVLAAEASFHDLKPNPEKLLTEEVIDLDGIKTRFIDSEDDYSFLDLMIRKHRWQNRLLFKTEGFNAFLDQTIINLHDTAQSPLVLTDYPHLISVLNVMRLNLEQVKSYQLSQFEYDVDLPEQFKKLNSNEVYNVDDFLNKIDQIDQFGVRLIQVLLTVGAVLILFFLVSLFGAEGSYLNRIRNIVFGLIVVFCLGLVLLI